MAPLIVLRSGSTKRGKDKIKPSANNQIPVLFVGSVRYDEPPDPTLVKKWRGLRPFFLSTIIAYRAGAGPLRSVLEGAQWILLPAGLPRFIRYCLHFFVSFAYTFCAALLKKYRAVIAQSPYEALAPALALMPWKIARSASKPRFIIEVHSDWQEGVMLYHRSRFSRIEKLLRTFVGRLSLSQADAYRAISDYCCGLLPKDQKPVFVFPTYTDLASFREPSTEIVREVARQVGQRFFLYAGMLIYLKGVHHLIRAFNAVVAKHPDVKLIIAGKGPAEGSLKELVNRLGIDGCVHFVGHLDQQTLGAYTANSSALVLPSLTEGLGRVAIEAQLLERPVIASRVGGLPEIVSDGKTGILFEPGDEEALTNAVIKMLEHKDLADSMGKAGKKAVLEKFNYRTYFQSYYDMVIKTCNKPY